MALPKPSTGLLPAENYRRFGLAFDAIEANAGAIVTEARARDAAIQQERADRTASETSIVGRIEDEADERRATDNGLVDRIDDEAAERRAADTSLATRITDAVAAEARDRASAVAAERAEREDGEAGIVRRVESEAKQRQDADNGLVGRIEDEDRQRRAADNALATRIGVEERVRGNEVARLDARDVDLAAAIQQVRLDLSRDPRRPGDGPQAFTLVKVAGLYRGFSALGGPPAALPPLGEELIAFGQNGYVISFEGSGVVGMRRAVAVEYGRVYRARFVFRRRVNASDPTGDAVVCGLALLDQTRAVLPETLGQLVVKDVAAPRVADGRIEVTCTFARSPGPRVQRVVTASVAYVRAYLRGFGPDARTDVEVLEIEDITGAAVMDPVSADIAARVAQQESLGAGPRLTALEAAAQNPNSLTFATQADAASASVAPSVGALVLRGKAAVGDGLGGLDPVAVRTPGPLPAGVPGFRTQDGAYWRQRVLYLPDVVDPRQFDVRAGRGDAAADTTAIQAAIDSRARVIDLRGRPVWYLDARGLTGVPDQLWLGVEGVTRIVFVALRAGHEQVSFRGTDNAVVDGILFDQNGLPGIVGEAPVVFADCKRWAFLRSGVLGIDYYGLSASNVEDYRIEGNRFERKAGPPPTVTDATTGTTRNRFSVGLTLSPARGPNPRGRVIGNRFKGLGANLDVSESLILFNSGSGASYGGGIVTQKSATCYGNVKIGNIFTDAVGRDTDETNVSGMELHDDLSVTLGNICARNSGNGLVNEASRSPIVGNVAYDNGQSVGDGGISCYGTCSATLLIGNASGNRAGPSGPQKYGIQFADSVSYTVVAHNALQGNRTAPADLGAGPANMFAGTPLQGRLVLAGAVVVPAGGSAEFSVTVRGAIPGDMLVASYSAPYQGLTLSCGIEAANNVRVMALNRSASPVTLPAGGVVTATAVKIAASPDF